jgi:hypothetical protein
LVRCGEKRTVRYCFDVQFGFKPFPVARKLTSTRSLHNKLLLSKYRGIQAVMGRPGQSTARLAVLLLLLAAACASASPAPARPTVMDTLRARMQQTGGPAQVKTAASLPAEEYDVEQKELCLIEKERTACKNVGPTASFWT